MNFRSRDLLNLCYEFDCLLQIPSACTGGTGEPCHANWSWAGKGGAMKAHDAFVVPGCRACHMALDQGSGLSGEVREGYWLRAFGKFLPKLFERGLLAVAAEAKTLSDDATRPSRARVQKKKRESRCTRPEKILPRTWGREQAEGAN